jgi:hypothetical protein
LWGESFEVKPGARTGIHHHGEQQTIAYVLSGICEVRRGARGEYVAREGRRFHPCAHLPAAHGDQSIGFGAFSLGGREEHLNADRREPSRPYVAMPTATKARRVFIDILLFRGDIRFFDITLW